MTGKYVDSADTADAAWELIRTKYAALLRTWGLAGTWTLGVVPMPVRDTWAPGGTFQIQLFKDES